MTDKCEVAKEAGKKRKMTGNMDIEGDNRENVSLSAWNIDISGSNFSNLVISAGNIDISRDNQGVITSWAGNIDIGGKNGIGSHICAISGNIEVWSNQGIITVKNGSLNIGKFLNISTGSVWGNNITINGDSISMNVVHGDVTIDFSDSPACPSGICINGKDIKSIKKMKGEWKGVSTDFSINQEISFDLTASKVEFKWKVYMIDSGNKKLGDYVFRKNSDNTINVLYKGQNIIYSKNEGIRVEAVK